MTDEPKKTKPVLDRATARALTEAGYMPLSEYIRLFGDEVLQESQTPKKTDLEDRSE